MYQEFINPVIEMIDLEEEFATVAQNTALPDDKKLYALRGIVDRMAKKVWDGLETQTDISLYMADAFISYLQDKDMLQSYLHEAFNEKSCDGEKVVCFVKTSLDRHIDAHIKTFEQELTRYDFSP